MQRNKTTVHYKEKNQSIEGNPEWIQMLKLAEKDIKTVIITVLLIFRKLEEILSMVSRHMWDIFKRPKF